MMAAAHDLAARCDFVTGSLGGQPVTRRRLADLQGCFLDADAFGHAVDGGNPVVYSVSTLAPGDGVGDLHAGLAILQPGRVGNEYWMTKGHAHAWREAGEWYVGLRGSGLLLLEDVATGDARIVPLTPQTVVYVPGNTAHRTINSGAEPLAYLGIYAARAGHDYAVGGERGFRHAVVAHDGAPQLVARRGTDDGARGR